MSLRIHAIGLWQPLQPVRRIRASDRSEVEIIQRNGAANKRDKTTSTTCAPQRTRRFRNRAGYTRRAVAFIAVPYAERPCSSAADLA